MQVTHYITENQQDTLTNITYKDSPKLLETAW